MQADIKAAKNSDCRDLVSRADASKRIPERGRSTQTQLVAHALFPVSKDSRDEMFDEWLKLESLSIARETTSPLFDKISLPPSKRQKPKERRDDRHHGRGSRVCI